MGNLSIVISVAPGVGPTVSGVVLSFLGWRAVFLVVLPIALVTLWIGLRRMVDVGEPTRSPIDALSVALSVVGFGGLVYGLSEIGAGGAGAMLPTWVPFVVGGLGIAAFVARQLMLQRTDRALLDLRTFRSRTFTTASLIMMLMMARCSDRSPCCRSTCKRCCTCSPLATGLLLLPGGLIMGLLGPVVGRLYDRVGARRAAAARHRRHQPGAVVEHVVRRHEPGLVVLGFHVLLSVGLAFVFTPLFTAGLGAVEPRLYSYGSAIFGTTQQLAGAAGVALLVSVLSVGAAGLTAAGASPVVATAGGVHQAFVVAAVLSVLAIVAASRDAHTQPRRRSRSPLGRGRDGAGWARDVDGRAPACAGPAPADLPPAAAQLRAQVREFLAAERAAGAWTPRADVWLSGWDERFTKELGRRGWLGMTIPVEYGGPRAPRRWSATSSPRSCWPRARRWPRTGWPTARSARPCCASAPRSSAAGTCRGIAAGEVYFGIGMSEPDSGSDLASVRTKAEQVDGGWALTGTKVWTSGAHRAHAFFALARTAPRDDAHRHAGLSQFIVELSSPGVTIRPIPLLTGAHHFNEVVFDGVFVPDAMVLGEIGSGWHQVTSELAFERSGPERFLSTYPLLAALVGELGGPTGAPAARSERWSRGCGRCGGCRSPSPVRSPPGRRPSSRRPS